MSALERFIRANDKLVNFEQQLTDSVITDSSIFALEVHRDELKAIWIAIKSLYEKCVDHFDKQETKLADDGREDDSDSDSATGNTDLDSINSRYHASYDTYVRIVSKLNSNIHERGRLPSIAPPNVPTSNFHLPACDTESFRGDYQSWPSFRDMFSAVYVKNSSLSKVQKLFHLRKKTEGEAHEIVKKCPLTNSGFDIAWANLTDRFENKRMLVHSQLRVLLNLATITSESSEGIKGLQRDINSCISCLKLYDVDVSTWDAIFVYICSTKLPRTSLSLWEQSIKNKKDVSKWSELDSFLSSRYQTLETISEISGVPTPNLPHSNCNAKKQNNSSTRKVHSNHAKVSSSQNNPTCNLCIGESHPIRKCPKFLQMNVNDRMSCIKRLNLCINCFAKSHNVKKCKSPYSCFSCHRRHNSLLHNNTLTPVSIDSTPTIHSQVNEELQDPQIQSTSSIDPPGFPLSSEGRIQSCFASHSQNVLLGTALVQITHLGMRYIVRALIDSGSQGTFLSERIFQLLKLPFRPVEAEISGLNGVTSANARKLVNLTVCPRFESDVELNITALVVPQLSGNLPTSPINSSILQQLPGIQLADPMFYQCGRVDMLIGADLFNNILLENVKKNICGSLVAQETVFGWIITGPVVSQSTISSFSTMVSFVTECTLEKQLRRFWEVEDVPQQPMLSQADSFCEALYTETTTRDEDGRYIVALPFRPEFLEGYRILGDSRALAERQFLRNEARLLKNVEQKSMYDSVLYQYEELGHMEKLMQPVSADSSKHYYLPHHAVMKPDSVTTKVRVVFNASCPTSSGISLNDILYPGPTLQNDLAILLLRWRFFRFVFSADIEKMYRQIKVHPKDSCFQRILFRMDPSEPMQDFELKTVTFGVNAAPYLAIRTLQQLAKDSLLSFPHASRIIEQDMYVDDVLTGSHDIHSAIEFRNQLILALDSACFPLRKWTSNSAQLLQDLPKDHLLKEDFLVLDDTSQTKTLGVRWNAKSDCFFFSAPKLSKKPAYTKVDCPYCCPRQDPYAENMVVKGGLGRDYHPLQCLQYWREFLGNYASIESIRIPRWVSFSPTCQIQFHAFCDASEDAYAAVIYTRVHLADNTICVKLLTSKSRVAPVKSISIPKLELCGATLLAEIVHSIVPFLNVNNYEIYKWTDSSILLSWLRKPACHWKVFVANRVTTITNKVGIDNWSHVASKFNPADLASRGVCPQDLLDNQLWWHGPPWLEQPPELWPGQGYEPEETNLEQKSVRVHLAVCPDKVDILERFSCYSRAIKVLCYAFRFYQRTHPTHREHFKYRSTCLTSVEFSRMRNKLIVLAQENFFPETVNALSKHENIPKSSSILNLNPFLDDNGVIRASGRLAFAPSLSYDERFPIIMPYNCQFSRLLVKFVHHLCLHGGNQQVINLVRLQFWIPKLRNLVKSTIHQCKKCVLHKKKIQQQLMAALPPERTTLRRPFHSTGIDFAGPFEIRSFADRGYKINKGYVCVFICFATKAIHLEATSSLSTAAFLAAFQRFVSRRGCPLNVYSDNGTNFIGASKEIAHDFLSSSKSSLLSQFAPQQLSWHFIPPGAPHMGGLWEAGVKSFNTHLKKVSGSFNFTFEEFCTLLSKIEACLNSRPISTISDDPADLNPLTPGHFLTGGPILAPPEPTYDNDPESVVNRWQRVKVLHQNFCQRWKMEYLKELHKRNKWKNPTDNIRIDSIVVIRDENLPPNEWRLGRVIKLHPGKDNRVRVADIYTQKGVITRPVVKLVLLPTQ
ncbi:uncharacterized protein LOC142231346 [Haematobia irritans]|uniref:uncharacterized protein LOC142231346 n=1 Tax=Haematobia irritans TaxID=7368 RepID=UPI003F500201